jgi:hypothetical protein
VPFEPLSRLLSPGLELKQLAILHEVDDIRRPAEFDEIATHVLLCSGI